MPHSSGGGSHGGGSHHSSSSHSSSHRSSSGGGSSRIRTSHTYFPGARRFVYYRNGVPNYVYSDTDLSKGPSKLRFFNAHILCTVCSGGIFDDIHVFRRTRKAEG